jgi:hypothetical protein
MAGGRAAHHPSIASHLLEILESIGKWSYMSNEPKMRTNAARINLQTNSATPTRTYSPNAELSSRTSVGATGSQSAEVRTAKCTELPSTKPPLASKPLSACDDNPVLNDQGASFILGVSVDLLKKWRQRRQDPDYIQYGARGLVRYELKALVEFRDHYKIYLDSSRCGRLKARTSQSDNSLRPTPLSCRAIFVMQYTGRRENWSE